MGDNVGRIRKIVTQLCAVLALMLMTLTVTTPGAYADGNAATQDHGLVFFRIGNGSTAGTYYPIGGALASAISNPPGGQGCEKGGACGVPGVLAAAMASAGSVANIEAMASGKLESAFAQADIAFWAQTGSGPWAKRPAVGNLRAIGRLFPEAIHLIVRRDSRIQSLADLRGARVSLAQPGSGTLVDARLILQAVGLDANSVLVRNTPPGEAATLLARGQLDAFFFVGGWPAPLVSQLASRSDIRLIELAGPKIAQLAAEVPFFQQAEIPARTYPGIDRPTKTLTVSALWVTMAEQPDDLIHAITRVLWNDNTMRALNFGHPTGRQIHRNQALEGVSIPLHPGAARYYQEAGLLPH